MESWAHQASLGLQVNLVVKVLQGLQVPHLQVRPPEPHLQLYLTYTARPLARSLRGHKEILAELRFVSLVRN